MKRSQLRSRTPNNQEDQIQTEMENRKKEIMVMIEQRTLELQHHKQKERKKIFNGAERYRKIGETLSKLQDLFIELIKTSNIEEVSRHAKVLQHQQRDDNVSLKVQGFLNHFWEETQEICKMVAESMFCVEQTETRSDLKDWGKILKETGEQVAQMIKELPLVKGGDLLNAVLEMFNLREHMMINLCVSLIYRKEVIWRQMKLPEVDMRSKVVNDLRNFMDKMMRDHGHFPSKAFFVNCQTGSLSFKEPLGVPETPFRLQYHEVKTSESIKEHFRLLIRCFDEFESVFLGYMKGIFDKDPNLLNTLPPSANVDDFKRNVFKEMVMLEESQMKANYLQGQLSAVKADLQRQISLTNEKLSADLENERKVSENFGAQLKKIEMERRLLLEENNSLQTQFNDVSRENNKLKHSLIGKVDEVIKIHRKALKQFDSFKSDIVFMSEMFRSEQKISNDIKKEMEWKTKQVEELCKKMGELRKSKTKLANEVTELRSSLYALLEEKNASVGDKEDFNEITSKQEKEIELLKKIIEDRNQALQKQKEVFEKLENIHKVTVKKLEESQKKSSYY